MSATHRNIFKIIIECRHDATQYDMKGIAYAKQITGI